MAITLSGDAATTRTSLGLGSAATLDVGTGANQILQLDGSGNLPAVNGAALTGIDTLPTQTGNAGKALVTDGSSASWGTAGSMVKLAGAQLNGTEVAAIDIDVFTAEYTHYILILDSLNTANAGNIVPFLRYRNASGEVSSSSYHWATSHPHSTSTATQQHNAHGAWNDSIIRINGSNGVRGGAGTSSNEGLNSVIHIYEPFSSLKRTHVTFQTSTFEQAQTQYNVHFGAGMYQNTESFVGVRIQYSGDTICFGSWAMYGVAR